MSEAAGDTGRKREASRRLTRYAKVEKVPYTTRARPAQHATRANTRERERLRDERAATGTGGSTGGSSGDVAARDFARDFKVTKKAH